MDINPSNTSYLEMISSEKVNTCSATLLNEIKNYFKYRKSTDFIYYIIPRILVNGQDYTNHLNEMRAYNIKLKFLLTTKSTLTFEDWREKFRRIKLFDMPVPVTKEDERAIKLYKEIKGLLPEHELMYSTDHISL